MDLFYNTDMAMGTRKKQEAEEGFWVARAALPTGAGHPFYQRLNQLLDETRFDRFVEERCQRFYAHTMGRPSLAPGAYFRLLLGGYFEGIDSEGGGERTAAGTNGGDRRHHAGSERGAAFDRAA